MSTEIRQRTDQPCVAGTPIPFDPVGQRIGTVDPGTQMGRRIGAVDTIRTMRATFLFGWCCTITCIILIVMSQK
jgi:hypothetical protein